MSVPLAVFVKSAITFPLTFGVLDVPPAFAEDAVPDFGMMISGAFGVSVTTFVGQNYGARQLDRCRKTFALCLLEDVLVTVTVMGVVLYFGHSLLALFNRDPEVIALGYIRLSIIFSGYLFSLLYELMSGYLRGSGISLAPAVLTTLGVCGIRIFWVQAVFPRHADFQTLRLVYPLSLFVTAVLILAALIVCRPTTRMKKQEKKEISA